FQEAIKPRRRAEERGKGRGVVQVAAPSEKLERGLRPTESWAAKSARPHSSNAFDGFVPLVNLPLDLLRGKCAQPGIMVLRVIADFVSGGDERLDGVSVFALICILTDYERRDPQFFRREGFKYSRRHQRQVGGVVAPTLVALRAHVRPFVVEIE